VNVVVRYGFALGNRLPPDEPEKHVLFPTLSRSSHRDQIIDRNAFCLCQDIDDFRGDLLFLSFTARTVKNNHILDFVIMKSSMQSRDFPFLLYDSITVGSSSMLDYKTATSDVLMMAYDEEMRVASIVGDGFSSQFFGLSPEYQNSIQNDELIYSEHPWIRTVSYTDCRCHLANLVLSDCQKHSGFMSDCRDRLNQISVELQIRESHYSRKKVCQKLSSTR
jgi:hypothetical protein